MRTRRYCVPVWSGRAKISPVNRRTHHTLTRREMLHICGAGLVLTPLANLRHARTQGTRPAKSTNPEYQGTDEQLLDEIQKSSFRYFWDEADSGTGQVKDRAIASGGGSERMSSIAATGFGLTALCIADYR